MLTSTLFTADSQVIAIGEGLLARSLPKAQWTHAAHFAAAIWLLRERAALVAETHMPGFIRAYNESTGIANTASTGYHETITLASLRAARAFLAGHPGLGLSSACNALLATPLGGKDWMLEYWSPRRLLSTEARRRWLDPDLKALPF